MSDFNSESRLISNQEYDQLHSQLREKDAECERKDKVIAEQHIEIEKLKNARDDKTEALFALRKAEDSFRKKVEELKNEQQRNLNYAKKCDSLKSQLAKYKAALEFYADMANHNENLPNEPEPAIIIDSGFRARAALAEEEGINET